MHFAHIVQNWLSYLKLAIIALTFSAMSFAELQRLRGCSRTLATENEELRKQLDASVKNHEASERSDAKHINDLLEANDEVVELKRENANLNETSRVQLMLLDQTKEDSEELKDLREQSVVHVSRIKCYKQRAEGMERKVADYDKLDSRHTAERVEWKKQQLEIKQQLADRNRDCKKLAGKLDTSTLAQEVAKWQKLYRNEEAKVLRLEKTSREENKSGRKAEKELKSSATKIKSLQQQLETQKTENAQMYSLKFVVSQLEQDAKQAAAKIALLEEDNRRLTAQANELKGLPKKVQELMAEVVAAEGRETATKLDCAQKLKAADDRQTQTKNECDERIKGIEARCKDECDERITGVKTRCKEAAVKRVRAAEGREAKTKNECDEKVKIAEKNEAKARQDSLLELQKSRKLSKENEELKAQLAPKDNEDTNQGEENPSDDEGDKGNESEESEEL